MAEHGRVASAGLSSAGCAESGAATERVCWDRLVPDLEGGILAPVLGTGPGLDRLRDAITASLSGALIVGGLAMGPDGTYIDITAPAEAVPRRVRHGHVRRAAPRAKASRAQLEVCPVCDAPMLTHDAEYRCSACGLVRALGEDVATVEQSTRAPDECRIRVCGADSRWFQRDFDRTVSPNRKAEREASVVTAYIGYSQRFVEKGGQAFPVIVMRTAAARFCAVQAQKTARSSNRRGIMAACLREACIQHNMMRSNIDISAMLEVSGIARGTSAAGGDRRFVQADADVVGPWTRTVFDQLGLGDDQFDDLRSCVSEVVDMMGARHVATKSKVCSKVHGAISTVLIRARDSGRFPEVTSGVVCKLSGLIRTNTVTKVEAAIAEFPSWFDPVMTKYGLGKRV